jgi:transcriptional regulator with XRE-family HTH domain
MNATQEAKEWEAALAATIRAESARLGMTPPDMVKATGIPSTSYWWIHTGQRSIKATQLRAIAKALGLTPGALFDLADKTAEDLVARDLRRAGVSESKIDSIGVTRKGEESE